MAYATIAHVQARSPQRQITGSSRPSADQVVVFLEDCAAELDGLLLGQGYALPVPADATQALAWLRRANAVGAAAMVETAAPTSKPDADGRLTREWRDLQAQLVGKGGRPVELALARSVEDTAPRGRLLSELSTASSVTRMSRDMEL